MNAKAFFGVVGVFVLAVGVYAWFHHRERLAQQARDAIEERKAAEVKRKRNEAEKVATVSERVQRAEEVRVNDPERNRLRRRYPELWDALEKRAGDLSRCIVTASGEQRLAEPDAKGRLPDREMKVVLSARCGEKLDQVY